MLRLVVYANASVAVPTREKGIRGFETVAVPGEFAHVCLGFDATTTLCGLSKDQLRQFETLSFVELDEALKCSDCVDALTVVDVRGDDAVIDL